MIKRIFLLSVILSFTLIFWGCEKDSTGPENDFGSVSGKINFIGTWPSNGDIQVSIYSAWPPMGPPDVATDPLPSGSNSQSYKIEGISKGDYSAIVVGWRDPADPAGAKIIGIYHQNANSAGVDATGLPTVAPTAINISNSNLNFTTIDMQANLDIAPK